MQSTGAYGYTYPEIAAAGQVGPDELSQSVYQAVEQLYGGGSFFSSFRVSRVKAKDTAVESLRQGVEKATITPVIHGDAVHIPKQAAFTAVPLAKKVAVPAVPAPSNPSKPSNPSGGKELFDKLFHHHPPSNPHPPQNPPETSDQAQTHTVAVSPPHPDDYVVTPDTYRDWIANVTLEKYALKGSGRVCFFLGPSSEIPANPADWFTSPIYVGAYSIFATNPDITGCENCKDQADKKSRVGGTVHLTKALIRHQIPLTGQEPVDYLKENLHWRCSDVHDQDVPREQIPSLKIIVQSAGYTVPPGGTRPQRGPWFRHLPITRGRPGGVDHEDEFILQ